jgi:hypothetical protein
MKIVYDQVDDCCLAAVGDRAIFIHRPWRMAQGFRLMFESMPMAGQALLGPGNAGALVFSPRKAIDNEFII